MNERTVRRRLTVDILTIVLVIAGWLLLTQVILPRLGVPT